MKRLSLAKSWIVRFGLVGITGALVFAGQSAFAVHEDLEFPAAIHAGSCEAPGDEVLALENLTRLPEDAPDSGERAGAPGSQVVHGTPDDYSIDLTIDDLFAADHILAVFDAEGTSIIACGPIGAYTYEDGNDVAIGLRSQGDSPYSGVAIFESGDDEDGDDDSADGGTEVDVYLVNNTPAPAATPVS